MQSVATRFSSFLGELKSADWQIGITTTDVSEGIYGFKGSLVRMEGLSGNQKILTPSSPRKETVFASTLVRPETISCGFSPTNPCPSIWVQPIKASQMAMDKRGSENRGFFRTGADLAIVTISNKDEMRNGRDFNPTQPESLVNSFNTHFAHEGKKLATFGVVIPSGQPACLEEMKRKWHWDPSPGTFQERLAKMTGGDVVSICAGDFGAELARLGQGVRRLTQSFDLRVTPRAGSVRIQIRPAQSIRFEVKERRVIFETAPQAGSEIIVTYEPAP
ncbi:MAG: hypothetical protein K2X47_15330 [Bdellovibrionales bacterium]|nr:hypothetical protein [Bdellovibrionales bacterium]